MNYKTKESLESKQDYLNYINKEFESNGYGRFIVIGVHHINDKGVKFYSGRFIETGFEFVQCGKYIRQGKIMDNTKTNLYKNKRTPLYEKWIDISKRIKRKDGKCKTYQDCTISKDWVSYAIFKKDYKNLIGYEDSIAHKNVKFDLDKDILFHGNREYSKTTCCIVPSDINVFFCSKQSNNTSGYEGVSYHERSQTFRAGVRLGKNRKRVQKEGFKSTIEAYEWYMIQKREALKILLAEYNWIDSRIKTACITKLEKMFEDTLIKNKKVLDI